MSEPLVLNFAPGIRFECTSCGKCCQSGWEIPVESSVEKKIRGSRAYQERERQGYTPLHVVRDELQLRPRPNGHCSFLNDKDMCDLHAEIGGSEKPVACRTFPFSVKTMPDGYWVSASFACPAVLAGVGTPLSAYQEELTGLIASAPSQFPSPKLLVENPEIQLSDHCTILWDEYTNAVEPYLLTLLSSEDPVSSLLIAAATITQLQAGSVTPDSVTDLSQSPEVLQTAQMAMSLLNYFAATSIAMVEYAGDPESWEPAHQALMGESEPHYCANLDTQLVPFQIFQASSTISQRALLDYLKSALFGRLLINANSVTANLLKLATSISMVTYYLEIQSRRDKTLHFDFQHLEEAFFRVETGLFLHTTDYDELFVKYAQALVP